MYDRENFERWLFSCKESSLSGTKVTIKVSFCVVRPNGPKYAFGWTWQKVCVCCHVWTASRRNSQWVLIHARVSTDDLCVLTTNLLVRTGFYWNCWSEFLQLISRSLSLSLSRKFSMSKTLDLGRLKPPNSNPTPETWSLLQDLCFHQLV
jgi:hypothetical protein